MSCLTLDQLKAAKTRKTVKHALPMLGKACYVNVRALSGSQLKELSQRFGDSVEGEHSFDFAAALLSYCLVDDSGERILQSDEDVVALLDNSHQLIEELGKVAIEVSGLNDSKKN